MPHPHVKAFMTAWALSHAIYKNEERYLLWKNRIRFSLVSLLSAPDSAEWFAQLAISAWIRPVLDKIPVLAFKPMRPYLSTKWDLGRKKKVIWDTYDLIRQYPVLWKTMLASNGKELACVEAGKSGKLSIVFCDCHHSTSKEGEVMVLLRSQDPDRDVVKMTFSFEKVAEGRFNCYIGCIQGADIDNREEIKAITKAMHGLRPTSLMIFVVREIVAAMDIDIAGLMGLGNQIHPFRKKHLIHLPFVHQINFNYDSLWEDAGAVPDEDGWFRLPVRQERRESGEIKSKKKMLYQRRYAMMDDLAKQIHDTVRGAA
ncbi:MAG: DUF535 domain-containing protein [Chlorobiaceae bacterium]|nr:DUF535 domain-containing protein [Chlorobiaceae bacterium]